MRRCLVSSAALLVAMSGLSAVAGELKSGLEIGDAAGAFTVKDITGPNQGKSLCYRWAYGARPVVSIFARQITDNLASLVKQIDRTVAKNEDQKMAAFVVVLTDDGDAAEAKLKALAEKHGIAHTPLTVYGNVAGPPSYNVSEDAEVTVLMWVNQKVTANHAFAKGQLTKAAVKKVVADTAKILR